MASKQSSRRISILDRSISKGKNEINLSTFALLFAEIVRYEQSRVNTIAELQNKLSSFGGFVGSKLTDLIFFREKGYKREVKLLNMLLFIKTTFMKNVFGKEADKLERNSENPRICRRQFLFLSSRDVLRFTCRFLDYIIENDPLVNTFISIPKDKGSLNVAAFTGGLIESVLKLNNFPCTVTTVWHNGTTYVIEFDEAVIVREKAGENK
ncbi:transport protein particle component, Bet3 [Trichuris suis]|nr:transport protein particle component, Bet3 [Trichuris suis]